MMPKLATYTTHMCQPARRPTKQLNVKLDKALKLHTADLHFTYNVGDTRAEVHVGQKQIVLELENKV